MLRMGETERPRRRRRRQSQPEGDGKPDLGKQIDERIQQAISRSGFPDLGAKVGQAVGQVVGKALDSAASEFEKARRAPAKRRHAAKVGHDRPRPQRGRNAPRRGRNETFELFWGLLRIDERDGEERIEVLWGLLDFVTRRTPAGDETRQAASGSAADPYGEALASTESRMNNLRSACVLGGLALGCLFLSLVSDGPLWRALWGVTSVVTTAVSGGLLMAVLAEGLRGRWLRRELDSVRGREDGRRAASGRHAADMQALTASIAHEIRNPITAAKSLVQQMGEDPRSAENVEYAEVALQELERVERSISHLLRFARDEEVSLESMRLADVVESAVATLADRAAAESASIRVDLDEARPIEGDREQLRRVFLNLIGNALDALRDANTPQPVVQVQIGENLAGTEVWARVRDNGPGIEPQRLDKIWTPFYTSKSSGTGLGLAITRKLVETHGGHIEVTSTPEKGTEFVMTFPLSAEAIS